MCCCQWKSMGTKVYDGVKGITSKNISSPLFKYLKYIVFYLSLLGGWYALPQHECGD